MAGEMATWGPQRSTADECSLTYIARQRVRVHSVVDAVVRDFGGARREQLVCRRLEGPQELPLPLPDQPRHLH